MDKLLIAAGVWILSDSIYSIMLYLTAPGCEGVKRQTWKRDHWLRVLRGLLAILIIWIGAVL